MARPARIEYEGAFYHLMNRWNGRENIFLDNKDRNKFYEILGKVETRYKIVIYSFVLMSNHYHILLETPLGNLSRAIQRLNGDYALYFSRRYKRPGHLFQGRYKAMLVEKDAYLFELSRYIHLNPVRAGMVDDPEKYQWSSLYEMLKKKGQLPFTLYWEWMLTLFGERKRPTVRKYLDYICERIKKNENPGLEASGGWILGSESWVKRITEKWLDFTSKELTGIKPLRPQSSIRKVEAMVCKEFEISKKDFKSSTYRNIPRMAMIYLAVNYCGVSLKDTGRRYGRISVSAVHKVSMRFKKRLLKDKGLNQNINNILSIGEM